MLTVTEFTRVYANLANYMPRTLEFWDMYDEDLQQEYKEQYLWAMWTRHEYEEIMTQDEIERLSLYVDKLWRLRERMEEVLGIYPEDHGDCR